MSGRSAPPTVTAPQQAAAQQVAVMQSQLDDAKAAREEDEKHKRKIERAYVSGGAARASEPLPDDDLFGRSLYPANARRLRLADGSTIVLPPTDLFALHINNHGKTPKSPAWRRARASQSKRPGRMGAPSTGTIGRKTPPGSMKMDEPTPTLDLPESRQCAVCGEHASYGFGAPGFPQQPAEVWCCGTHRDHGERARGARYRPVLRDPTSLL
jgi:hypothetical protein